MLKEELYYELTLSYHDLVRHLINKYGPAQFNYFCTSELKSKNSKVSRTGEGLYCHHIFEDRGIDLSNRERAKLQPLEWQNKENLVYCNLFEHLILHIKIDILRQKKRFLFPGEIGGLFVGGGVQFICGDINDLFKSEEKLPAWKIRCFEEVKDNYEEYLLILSALVEYINGQYDGKRSDHFFLQSGSTIKLRSGDAEILRVSPTKNMVLLGLPDGREKEIQSIWLGNLLTYKDRFDMILRSLCTGREKFYEEIYEDVLAFRDSRTEIVARALGRDFRGYGFPQFTQLRLDKAVYGSENADEYVSKGLPSYSNPHLRVIEGASPIFWTGDIPRRVRRSDVYFLVRIMASFKIKRGQEAFVRYCSDAAKAEFSEENNLLFRKGVVLKNSYRYDRRLEKYCEFYRDEDGKVRRATVELTLGRDDFELFMERYEITSLKVLDGCYFL